MNQKAQHTSVLLQEVMNALDIKPGDIVFDATLGGSGHSRAISEQLGGRGILIAIDVDSLALKEGEEALADTLATVYLRRENFRNIGKVLDVLQIPSVDKFLFDLGMSSIQLEGGGRGLSFKKDEPLLMTLASDVAKNTLTASRIVNEWSEEHIETILRAYGEEPFSKRIAKAIVERRKVGPIDTTSKLVDVIVSATPVWYQKKRLHPATRVFQALRITVNDEIESLEIALRDAYAHLRPGGRIALITFHSIEDRVVKRTFLEWKKAGKGTLLSKRPLVPSREELKANPRSRSAKLRVFVKNP